MFYKKAQGWGADLFIAIIIFTMGISLIYLFSINFSGEKEEFDKLKEEADRIMENILSEGHPKNWNKSNVIKIGILNEGKVNDTKIEFFYNITKEDYDRAKRLFKTKYDYFFVIDQGIYLNNNLIEGIGKNGTQIDNIKSDNLVRVERYTIYKNKPIKTYLYLW